MKKTVNIVIVLSILCILAIAGYVFMFLKVREYNKTASEIKTEIDLKVGDEGKIKKLENNVVATEELRTALNSYFVHEKDVVSFLEVIETLGRETGVVLELKSVGVSDNNGGPLLLNMNTSGTWSQVFRFISLVESLPYRLVFSKAFMERDLSKFDGVVGWSSSLSLELVSFTKETL